jgi:hypothetical protein
MNASNNSRTSQNNNIAVQALNFGFDIPEFATIDGVEVSVEFSVSGGTWNINTQLYNASAVIGSSKTGSNTSSTTDITQTFGGASDLWGATLTRDIVNGSGYGVQITASRVSGAGNTRLRVDHVQMRITYTEGEPPEPPEPGAITLVQSKVGNGGGYNNTNVQSFDSSVTAGNTIILGLVTGTAETISSITDTQSNTYTQILSETGEERKIWLYRVNSANAGSTTVTVTYGTGQFADTIMFLREYSGLDTTNLVDQTASGNSGTSFVTSHASGTTSATDTASELIIGLVGSSGSSNPVFTAESGYSNLLAGFGFDAFTYGAIKDKIVSATGTQSATFGSTGSVRSATAVITLRGASEPAGTIVYVKVAGTFVEASVQTKVAGTFVPSTITKL